MITDSSILEVLNDVIEDVLTTPPGGPLPQINFYTSADVLVATISYDAVSREPGSDHQVVFTSGGSRQLMSTVVTDGDVVKFRIQYPGAPAVFLFEGSVGSTGRGADISFPSTYWPAGNTIVINNLTIYVYAGTTN